MNQGTKIVQFPVAVDVALGFEMLAAKEGRDMGAIFRDMYRSYLLSKALEGIQAATATVSRKLDLETDDNVARYLDEN